MPETRPDKDKLNKNLTARVFKENDNKLHKINNIRSNKKRSSSTDSDTSNSNSDSSSNSSSDSSSNSSTSDNSSTNSSSNHKNSVIHQKKSHNVRNVKKSVIQKTNNLLEFRAECHMNYKDIRRSQNIPTASTKEKGNLWSDRTNHDSDKYRKDRDRKTTVSRVDDQSRYVDRDKNKETYKDRDSDRIKVKGNDRKKGLEVFKDIKKDKILETQRHNEKLIEGENNKKKSRESNVEKEKLRETERDRQKERERLKMGILKGHEVSRSSLDGKVTEKSKDIQLQKEPKKFHKIHVTKLTRNVTAAHLREIFSEWGVLRAVDLPADHFHPEFSRGYAILEYEDASCARLAQRDMDRGQVDGQQICVVEVGPEHATRAGGRRSPAPRRHRDNPGRQRHRSPHISSRRDGRDRRTPLPRRRSRSR